MRREADRFTRLADQLIAEYVGRVPPGSVLRCLYRCRARLIRTGVRRGLVPATEAAVRVSLAATHPHDLPAA